MGTISVEADLCITLSTGVGVIGVLEITLIVPTLRVGMPPVTLRVTNGTDCGFSEPSAWRGERWS
ncbi:hypothetical protein, partial [Pseudomonas viridiflava]|uniref:hypothetical protein n=1 Tax=Pseudomonas viridiflava TaxID=33069 RepID=UPI0019807B89